MHFFFGCTILIDFYGFFLEIELLGTDLVIFVMINWWDFNLTGLFVLI